MTFEDGAYTVTLKGGGCAATETGVGLPCAIAQHFHMENVRQCLSWSPSTKGSCQLLLFLDMGCRTALPLPQLQIFMALLFNARSTIGCPSHEEMCTEYCLHLSAIREEGNRTPNLPTTLPVRFPPS